VKAEKHDARRNSTPIDGFLLGSINCSVPDNSELIRYRPIGDLNRNWQVGSLDVYAPDRPGIFDKDRNELCSLHYSLSKHLRTNHGRGPNFYLSKKEYSGAFGSICTNRKVSARPDGQGCKGTKTKHPPTGVRNVMKFAPQYCELSAFTTSQH
jgi:hypothetical protein